MKVANIISEQYLEVIKSKFQSSIDETIKNYHFEGINKSIFENLIIFQDDKLLKNIRERHYISIVSNDLQRTWNKYFWYLRYLKDMEKVGNKNSGHEQQIYKILEKLHQQQTIDNLEDFSNFAANFETASIIKFGYFNPCFIEDSISNAPELKNIFEILNINIAKIEIIDSLIWKNIDNPKAQILTFYSQDTEEEFISIDTFSAGVDQINPVSIFVQATKVKSYRIDNELVKWCERCWQYLGPSVNIVNLNLFEHEKYYVERERVIVK